MFCISCLANCAVISLWLLACLFMLAAADIRLLAGIKRTLKTCVACVDVYVVVCLYLWFSVRMFGSFVVCFINIICVYVVDVLSMFCYVP